jgi:hypothetical protein
MKRILFVCALAPLMQVPARAQTLPPFGSAVTAGRVLSTADMTNPQPLIPLDIYRNSSVERQDLATFAWLEFLSAVSPAGANRGETGGSFAQSGMSPAKTLVWENLPASNRVAAVQHDEKGSSSE